MSEPIDWPARFRAAAEVADGPWLSDPAGALYAAAHVLEQTPTHVIEDIGRALLGEQDGNGTDVRRYGGTDVSG